MRTRKKYCFGGLKQSGWSWLDLDINNKCLADVEGKKSANILRQQSSHPIGNWMRGIDWIHAVNGIVNEILF